MTKEATWRCAHGWLRGEQCELCKETMTKDKALKLALEALEAADWYIDQLEMIVYCVDDEGTHENRAKVQAAITAIKEALAQPKQEPVEDVVAYHSDGTRTVRIAPQRTWVGLTRREVEWCFDDANGSDVVAAKNIEAALRSKNT